jgi:hypothetical protein
MRQARRSAIQLHLSRSLPNDQLSFFSDKAEWATERSDGSPLSSRRLLQLREVTQSCVIFRSHSISVIEKDTLPTVL